jgi:hypothetical protein
MLGRLCLCRCMGPIVGKNSSEVWSGVLGGVSSTHLGILTPGSGVEWRGRYPVWVEKRWKWYRLGWEEARKNYPKADHEAAPYPLRG